MRGWLHPAIQTTVARFARKSRQRATLPVYGQGEAGIPDEHWFRRRQGRGGLCVDQALSYMAAYQLCPCTTRTASVLVQTALEYGPKK
jgi:hypothetical protein